MSWNSFWGGVGDWFKTAGETVWNGVKNVASGIGNAVSGVVSTVSNVLNKSGVAQAVSGIPIVGSIVNAVAGVASVADSVMNQNANKVQEQAVAQVTGNASTATPVSEAIKAINQSSVATPEKASVSDGSDSAGKSGFPWLFGGGLGALLLLKML